MRWSEKLLKTQKSEAHFIPCTEYNVFKCDRVCVGAREEKVMDSLAINGNFISNEGSDVCLTVSQKFLSHAKRANANVCVLVCVCVGVCANRRQACGTAWECSDLVFVVEMRRKADRATVLGHRAKLHCPFPLGCRGDGPGEHTHRKTKTEANLMK